MDDQTPSVSLIVVNWNGRHHLDSCLGSLRALEHPAGRLEVVLVDNGSGDGSVEHVRAHHPDVRVVPLGHNHGFAEANNIGSRDATGEWIGFLNNDMWVEPQWLTRLLSGLTDCPEAVCLSSRIMNWDGSLIDFIGGGVNLTGHGFQTDHGMPSSDADRPKRVLFACGGAMLIRRDVYRDVGGFDPSYFAYFEDVDLGWRLNLLGHTVWYTPAATAYHRHHSTGRRLPPHRLRLLYERNALYTIYKCLDDENLAAALPAALYLLNERALRLAEVDRRSFYINPPSAPRGSGRAQPTYAFDPAAAAAEGLRDKVRRIHRAEGTRGLIRKATRYARFRSARAATRAVTRLIPDSTVMPRVAASHYAALSDFAHNLVEYSDKRRQVQEHRRRTDAELMPLMLDPLWSSYSDPAYLEFHRGLVRVLELDRRFGVPE